MSEFDFEMSQINHKTAIELNVWMKTTENNVKKCVKDFYERTEIERKRSLKFMKVKRLTTEAILPKKHYAGDLGYDIYVTKDYIIHPIQDITKMDENSENHIWGFGKLETGIAIEMPEGYGLEVRSRSSAFSKKGLLVQGEIDNGYRGECCIMVQNFSGKIIRIAKGEAIAQIKPYKIEDFQVIEVAELTQTNRGQGGFGSTDNKTEGK